MKKFEPQQPENNTYTKLKEQLSNSKELAEVRANEKEMLIDHVLRKNLFEQIFETEDVVSLIHELLDKPRGDNRPTDYWGGFHGGLEAVAKRYSELVKEMLLFCAGNDHDRFFSLLEDCKNLDDTQEAKIKLFSEAIKKMQFAKGLLIAEIGGNFTKGVFESLGAEVDTTDAGLMFMETGMPGMDPSIIQSKPELMTQENYRDFFPKQYHIVCTNAVLDPGGIQAAVEAGGPTVVDFLLIEEDILAQGGLILNHHSNIEALKEHYKKYFGDEQKYATFKQASHKSQYPLSLVHSLEKELKH